MVRLRPYKPADSVYFLSWMRGELEFQKWCAGKFEFPLTEKQLEDFYLKYQADEYAWSMVALDEGGKPIGHFLFREVDYDKESVHIGYVIVDPNERGKGRGKDMMNAALAYAYDQLKVKTITLAVFENNPPAHNCYRSVGFVDSDLWEEPFCYGGERWSIRNMDAVRK